MFIINHVPKPQTMVVIDQDVVGTSAFGCASYRGSLFLIRDGFHDRQYLCLHTYKAA